MKKTLFITILLLLATIVVGLVIWSDKQSVTEPVVDTNAKVIINRISTESDIPSNLTLSSLQARSVWNPTLDIGGVYRSVDVDTNLDIQTKDKIDTYILANGLNEVNLLIKYATLTPEKIDYDFEFFINDEIGSLAYNPEIYNELIILSGDTGEVLHKIKLKDGFSLLNRKRTDLDDRVIFIHNKEKSEEKGSPVFEFQVSKWSSFGDKQAFPMHKYYIDILTGEIWMDKEFLSLAYLQSHSDWNPTQEIEGVIRVSDSVTDLEIEREGFDVSASNRFNNQELLPFIIKHTDSLNESSYCEKMNVTKKITIELYGTITPACLPYPPEKYNEFIVFSGDNGEVLHKFKYQEGYSIAIAKWSEPFSTSVRVGRDISSDLDDPINGKYYISFSVAKWNDFDKQDEANEINIYNLNLMTGEITKIKDSKPTP